MSILVVGSVAFDSVETPFGKADRVLGGAASFFSVAASFFTPVRLVGVVGDDFGPEQLAAFEGRDIDLAGLEHAVVDVWHSLVAMSLTSVLSTLLVVLGAGFLVANARVVWSFLRVPESSPAFPNTIV